jgi:F-type H+-transporting ATPase subunit gamma
MPNLKIVAMRLKSVTNIQKITQSMKMVSAAKYARAERDLKAARPLGEAAGHFYKQAEVGSGQCSIGTTVTPCRPGQL